jgi:hypothetical protein
MMRRRAGFESDEARRNPSKEREDLAASQPLAHHYAAHLVDRMNLEDTLCQIKTNCCNIAHGWLPLLVISNDHHRGTSMPSGGHPPHQLAAASISASTRRLVEPAVFVSEPRLILA